MADKLRARINGNMANVGVPKPNLTSATQTTAVQPQISSASNPVATSANGGFFKNMGTAGKFGLGALAVGGSIWSCNQLNNIKEKHNTTSY